MYFKSSLIDKYFTMFSSQDKNLSDKWKYGALKINLEEGKIFDILLKFDIINDNKLLIRYHNLFKKKYYIRCENIDDEEFYLSQDECISWNKMIKHEKITNQFPLNNYFDILLTYYVIDHMVFLLEYKIVITDIIRFKKLCWELYHEN